LSPSCGLKLSTRAVQIFLYTFPPLQLLTLIKLHLFLTIRHLFDSFPPLAYPARHIGPFVFSSFKLFGLFFTPSFPVLRSFLLFFVQRLVVFSPSPRFLVSSFALICVGDHPILFFLFFLTPVLFGSFLFPLTFICPRRRFFLVPMQCQEGPTGDSA